MSGETTIRAHLEAIRDRVGDPHVRRSANLNYQDAVAAIALLDEAAETEARVTTPSGFKLYKPARIVSDWTPGNNEPPAHGWPDPVVSSIATRDGQPS